MTDTLVLKNKLVMPQAGTYLELDQDEMEYVDGGGHYIVEKGWFGITHNVGYWCDPQECSRIGDSLVVSGIVAALVGIGLCFSPFVLLGVLIGVVGICVGLLGRTFSVGASTGKGVTIRWTNGFGIYVA